MGLLRLILALSVVITHSSSIFGYTIVGGKLAVQAFYMISGFYMALILNEKYIGKNNSYKLFITNRLLRLYPVYWVVLTFTVLLGLITVALTKGHNMSYFSEYVNYYRTMSITSFVFLIFTNIFLVFQDLVLFLGLDLKHGNLFFSLSNQSLTPNMNEFLFVRQAWTVGVEIMFYLIVPFIVRAKSSFIWIMIICSILLRVFLEKYGYSYDPWSYRFFPTELVFFLLGIMAYRYYLRIRQKTITPIVFILAFVYITLLTLSFSFITFAHRDLFFLLSFFICLPFVFLLSRKWTKDRYIGELSYPVYISHLLIMALLNKFNLNINSLYTIISIFVSILFSILINTYLVKYIEQFRQRRLIKIV